MIRPVIRLVVLLSAPLASVHAGGLPANLETTVDLYLSAATAYRRGDLITRSQLDDIQLYLKRTQGDSLATHPQWRHMVLPDSAPLVKIFYSGGATILREIAAKRGTYAGLDRLSRSGKGRQQLQRTIDRKLPAELIQCLAAQQAELAAKLPSPAEQRNAPERPKQIYTADEFLKALTLSLPAEPALETRTTATDR